MQPEMRPATLDDMPRLQEIVREVWAIGSDFALEEKYGSVGGERWDRWLVPKVMSRLWEEIGSILVTEIEGEIAGFISYALDRARQVGTIHYNAVDPHFQGQGIGTMQVQRVLELFRDEGMRIACVGTGLNEGHAPARRMYEKAGFEPVIDYRMYSRRLD
ncbi:MAG: GNAT family N-acetyltransferase [Armatimonadota bacterium]|nr:GNAT family N-acetyltransferase [Armatimonadota bacterium]